MSNNNGEKLPQADSLEPAPDEIPQNPIVDDWARPAGSGVRIESSDRISADRPERIAIENDGECETGEEPRLRSKNKIRDVVIKQLDHGYIVKVGCQSFAIETPERITTALGDYLKDPSNTENNWFAGKFLNDEKEA
jgi:hypothetical protein